MYSALLRIPQQPKSRERMITRLDLLSYGSPTEFDDLKSNIMETTVEYAMEPSEVHCDEEKYPSPLYEFTQEQDNSSKEENVSLVLSNIVQDMLTPSSPPSSHDYSHSSAMLPSYSESKIKEEQCDTLLNISSNQEKLEVSIKDEFDMGEDFESLPYTQPGTPSDCVNNSDKYSSPNGNELFCSSSAESNLENEKPTCLVERNYDTSSLMYGTDDMTTFTGLVSCDEVLKGSRRNLEEQDDTIVCCYRSGSTSSEDDGQGHYNSSYTNDDNNNNSNDNDSDHNSSITNVLNADNCDKELAESDAQQMDVEYFLSPGPLTEDVDNRKGKISGLQRKALDSIFSVTDRPSRGLVLHIAGELCLHHITVKNFFSNGRRRLRRAAARLSDPERTRRENQKRKEKRRLAALAAAASATNGDKGTNLLSKGSSECGPDSQPSREPPVLSPERRALMKKLAVKVQRSVAQKGLAAQLGDSVCLSNSVVSSQSSTHNPSHFPCQNAENPLPTPIHSSLPSLSEPIRQSFGMHQYEPIEEKYLTQTGEEFGAIFSFPESGDEPMSSYDSSPDQNSGSIYSVDQDNTDTYALMSQEGGPYSPTSWQTLLHT